VTSAVVVAPGVRSRAAMLVMRYSLELTGVIEHVAGVGTPGNHEIQALTHLHASGPSCRKELIALTGLSRSGTAQLVERLEQLGLTETRQRLALASLAEMG
jgi:hypothetical protein